MLKKVNKNNPFGLVTDLTKPYDIGMILKSPFFGMSGKYYQIPEKHKPLYDYLCQTQWFKSHDYREPITQKTALMMAIEKFPYLVPLMLETGASIEDVDRYGCTALFYAARDEKSTDNLKLLLKKGANVHHLDAEQWTALMYACEDNPAALKILVEAGCPIDAQNKNGHTALMLAGRHNAASTIILLELGADSLLKNDKGQTASDMADEKRGELSEDDKEIICKILKRNFEKVSIHQVFEEKDLSQKIIKKNTL